jgi:hypothetical protein
MLPSSRFPLFAVLFFYFPLSSLFLFPPNLIFSFLSLFFLLFSYLMLCLSMSSPSCSCSCCSSFCSSCCFCSLSELVALFPEEDRDFLWSLLNTQQFSIHSEQLLESALKRKNAREVILQKVDTIINQEQQSIQQAQEIIR